MSRVLTFAVACAAFATQALAADAPAASLTALLGRAQIEDLLVDYYAGLGAGHHGSPHRPGTFRMLLTNLKIAVNGDIATADVLWTGVNSEKVTAPPQFIEQGRERDELVKRNGRWYFKHRVITSDGGMPPMFEKTYQKR